MSEEEILIALKEIHARYCIPASEQNYTDKDYACMQYEKLVIHLQKEIERLNNIINDLLKRQNEALNYISNFLSMDNRYKHGNGNDELQQENEQLKANWDKLKEYIRKNIIYDDVGMKILDPSLLEDYMQELKGSDKE